MKGSYALVLHISRTRQITVGRLGVHTFKPGYYVYLGSALNSLEGRLRRHLAPNKKLHWHVDYLAEKASLQQIWWAAGETRRECQWTQSALEHPAVSVPVKGFGASDCRTCPSHLLYVAGLNGVDALAQIIAANNPEPLTVAFPGSNPSCIIG